MKKLLFVLMLALGMAASTMSFVACNGNGGNEPAKETAGETTPDGGGGE